MPRYGWSKAHDEFCRRFQAAISQSEFEAKAKSILTVDGRGCSTRKFREEAAKRTKTIGDFFEENTLLEAKLFTKTFKVFEEQYTKVKNVAVEKVDRTRKVFSETLDVQLLGVINQAVEHHIKSNPPADMNAIAQLLQAAQWTYQVVTERSKIPSNWQESIEARIVKIDASTKRLEAARAHKPLRPDEEGRARKDMGLKA